MHLRERVNIADRHVLFLRGGSSTCVGMRSLCDGTAGELNTLLFQSPPEEGDSWTAVRFPFNAGRVSHLWRRMPTCRLCKPRYQQSARAERRACLLRLP